MRNYYNSERGATFVEAALVLPVFFITLFSIFSLSFALSQHALYTDGVRQAARTAVVTVGDCDTKKESGKGMLMNYLSQQALFYREDEIAFEEASTADEDGAVGFDKQGLELKIKGKLVGFIPIEYRAFSAFEGDDGCD